MFRSGIRRCRAQFASTRSFAAGRLVRNTVVEAANPIEPTTTPAVKSSCQAGTPLNLKVLKKGDEPVALEDSEYPAWLWTMTDPSQNLEKIKNEDFLRWRRIKLSKENNKRIKNNNFLSKM